MAISDDLLKHTVGIKLYDHTKYKKIPGTLAKYFICDKPGYAYPLFKTHKLDADRLQNISIFDFPTRLLQSAGNITTSKITALLEYIYFNLSALSFAPANSMNTAETANIIS